MALDSSRSVLIAILTIPENNNTTLDYTPVNPQEVKYVSSEQMARFKSISIGTKEATLTGTVTVQSLVYHRDDETAEASYKDVHSPPGTPVTIAAASVVVLTDKPFPAFILESSTNELGGARVFYVYGEP